MDLAHQYQYKTDKQHILDNPDTYIGSVEKVDTELWICDGENITFRSIEYIPGLYKLFDEGIVNCRDHVIRMIQSTAEDKKLVTYIDIEISEDGIITMTNDGNGVDIAKHPEMDIWIPEMVFGHLRTSTNYAKDETRIVGGKNGFGFKLVLIWSTYGRIETVDHIRKLKYIQEFHDNLNTISVPIITKCSIKPYTKVTFKPDYQRLGIPGLTPDIIALLKKRIYDISAITNKIKIKYNGELNPVKNFQQYVDLYIGSKTDNKRIYESGGERWEYVVALSSNHEFMQVSFVNGICTTKGGKHVDYIINQITREVAAYIEKKKKITVNVNSIKEQLILFIRCDIDNPSFDSQTKDFMNTPYTKFGSKCVISESFIEKIAKMGVMDLACSLTEAKEAKTAAKKTDGSKTKSIRGIPNLVDANLSGTAQSASCTLILCEGLSALSGIISGLSSADRNTIGIYPLKGKLLNVRGEQVKRVSENKEITDIKKILGLENGRKYEDVARLRYGKVMILCDQDTDGSHIKGLCINLFHSEWASLIYIPGFISFMNTPILRAKHKSSTNSLTPAYNTQLFYNEGEYQTWKLTNLESNWIIKYFKGLGTSTAVEFKEYFANKKIVDFIYTEQSNDSIDKVFNKKRADDRKLWLENYDKKAYLDTSRNSVNYEEFIDNELIHFSTYDCARSIPNAIDGLKISLRKILFAAFKRNLTSEIKVSQFSGYVSEHSSYHHGEASLNGAIVNMAQNFVGSNNINLLLPNGQFGSRLQGGSDSASERYIFTLLNPITRYIFPDADDAILNYLNDDGVMVEPEYYIPIIPFALINGITGIGTGFSCSIPSFNPKLIIKYLMTKLSQQLHMVTKSTETLKQIDHFYPYYENFKGTIELVSENKYLVSGIYEKLDDDKIHITELPIGTWTMPYITMLEELIEPTVDKQGKKTLSIIKDFVSICTEATIDITIIFNKGKLQELDDLAIKKLLKLTTTISTTNMHMFDHECKLHKYTSVVEIIEAYFPVRLNAYQMRKTYLITAMEYKLVKLSNRAKYIQESLTGDVDLRHKTLLNVNLLLTERNYDQIDGDFKYLIKMTMDSVTNENVAKILQDRDDTIAELSILKSTTIEEMWLKELNILDEKISPIIVAANKLSQVKKVVKKITKK